MIKGLFGTIENIRLALSSLLSNRLRALLTMLGITIGVASVVLLLSVGQAFEAFILSRFDDVGANTISLFGEQNENGEFEPLTQSEYEALSLNVQSADAVVTYVNVTGSEVTFEDRKTSPTIFGIPPEYIDFDARDVVAGRYITEEDMGGTARVAVIGSSAVTNLFPPGFPPLGQTIRIGEAQFRVVGVLSEGGSNAFVDLDNSIFVPITTAQQRLTNQRSVDGDFIVSQILFRAPDEASVDTVVSQVRDLMRELRDIDFNGEDNFSVVTSDELLSSIGTILNLLTYFLAAIASISLLVGGIGIMNIMLVTVTERTKEIGLRKALGAQNADILLQFVTEAVFLAVLGGVVGILIAVGMGFIITSIPFLEFNVVVQPFSVALAVSISTLIGVFFGYFPAQRAASLNPIDALRYE